MYSQESPALQEIRKRMERINSDTSLTVQEILEILDTLQDLNERIHRLEYPDGDPMDE